MQENKQTNEQLLNDLELLKEEGSRLRRMAAQQEGLNAQHFQLITELANDVIWTMDLQMRLTYVSPSVEELRGYTPEEAMVQTVDQTLTPESAKLAKEVLTEARSWAQTADLNQVRAFHRIVELEQVRKDGSTVWTEMNVRFLLDAEGRPQQVLGVTRNIDARKKAQEKLQQSVEDLRMLMESAKGFAVYQLAYDPDSPMLAKVVFASPSLKELAGVSDPDRLETWFEHIHPEDLPGLLEANQQSWTTGETLQATVRVFHPDTKKWRWLQGIASGVIGDDQTSPRCNGIIFDITEVKQAEEALAKYHDELEEAVRLRTAELEQANKELGLEIDRRRAAEQNARDRERRYRLIFDKSPVSIWELDFSRLDEFWAGLAGEEVGDPDALLIQNRQLVTECAKLVDVVDINQATLDLCAADNKEQLRRAGQIFLPETWDTFRQAAQAYFSGKGHFEAETRIQDLQGNIKYVVLRWSAITHPTASTKKVFVSLQDINERKNKEEQIKRLNRLQEELLKPAELSQKARLVTDGVVEMFGADFARIWITNQGDRCDSGCLHAKVTEGPHTCLHRERCLHLLASSGRYTHTDGEVHARVPFGCYKIGRVAAGLEPKFFTNNVANDPRVHDHEWAKKLGLVSFAGFQLLSAQLTPIGVLALFSKHALSEEEFLMLGGVANTIAQVIQTAGAEEALRESEERHRLVVETANEAIVIVQDGKPVFYNPKILQLTGFSATEYEAMTFWDYLHPDDMARVTEIHSRRMAGKDVPNSYDFRIIDKNQKVHWLHNNVVTIDWKGRPAGLNLLMDINDQKRAEEEKERLIVELQDALAKVKTLSGFLPICASCKKIRDDNGYWNQIEEYISKHSAAEFSHSICPTCMKRLYPEIADKILKKHDPK